MAMRQVAQPVVRPASRARARSPAAPSTRQSQASAYGFQSPVARGAQAVVAGPNTGAGHNARGPNEQSASSGAGGNRASQSRGSGQTGVGGSMGSSANSGSVQSSSRSSRLAVVVRKRPMNRREQEASQKDVVLCRNNSVIVREPKLKVDLTRYVEEHNFVFDHSFDENISNEQLYSGCVRQLIDAIFQGAKCTCFAYGQTGSGKTFTMMGTAPKEVARNPDAARTPGIFLLAAQDIFRALTTKEHSHLGVFIAFYEIYCGKLFDLLNNRQILHARENAKSNVIIVGLQEHQVENVQELMEVIDYGLNSRTTGVTGANVDSSRSHAVLQVRLMEVGQGNKEMSVHKKAEQEARNPEHGKISFIDLAGSERGADTMDIDRQTRMDGAEINKSLLALKECIRALDQQLDHTPFRGSKLTQVLKDSFIGSRCRTVMIANVSPCGWAVEHSLNTLRYAYRVKELRRAGPGSTGVEAMNLPGGGGQAPEVGEDCSDDDYEARDEPHSVQQQQQLRVANLSAAAQTFSSSQGAPERLVGIAGGDHGRRFDPPARGLQPEEVFQDSVAPRYAATSMANAQHPEAVVLGDGGEDMARGHMARGDAHSVQPQELAPEVALEPVGCSQAQLDELARQHDRLIGTILAEEEELITAHRQHIDMMVELIKEEMVHLNSVDRPGSDVDAYVAGIDRILGLKAQYIGDIRGRVDLFKEHLSQEDTLSRKFQTLASSSN